MMSNPSTSPSSSGGKSAAYVAGRTGKQSALLSAAVTDEPCSGQSRHHHICAVQVESSSCMPRLHSAVECCTF
jgi:hypothetical protein